MYCDLQNLLETSEVPTPKCVQNEIRDFEMTTAPYTSLNHPGMNINCVLWMQEQHNCLILKS